MGHRGIVWLSIVGLLAVGLSVGGCLVDTDVAEVDSSSTELPAYGAISPEEAATILALLSEDEDFVLLDIRTPAEVESGHIPGATMLDFYSPVFRDELAALDHDATYLIYCRTGNRTSQTRTLMAELGFTRVYDLGGGITQWIAQGHPTCAGPLDAEHVCLGALPAI